MLLAMFMLFACSKEEIVEPVLLLYTENIEFDDEGGTVDVVFEANKEWRVFLSDTWLAVSATNGSSGVSSITLTADSNKDYQGRSAKITIVCGTLTKEIEVRQRQVDYLKLSASSATISSDGGVLDVTVFGNIPFQIGLQDVDWISLLNSNSDGRVSFSVEANVNLQPRMTEIRFFNEEKGISESFVLEQQQLNLLSVEPALFDLGYKETSIKIAVNANVQFAVDTSDSWIHLESDTVDGYNHYLIFSVSENQEEETRTSEIQIVYNDMRETISVKQDGMPADITGIGSGYLKR